VLALGAGHAGSLSTEVHLTLEHRAHSAGLAGKQLPSLFTLGMMRNAHRPA
jgi:hypothetical protein